MNTFHRTNRNTSKLKYQPVNQEENRTPAIEVFYLSNDNSAEELNRFYMENIDLAPWCSLQWEEMDLVQEVKEHYNLESLPQVLVLDKNLRVITREGADDLRRLEPKDCREYWINVLSNNLV